MKLACLWILLAACAAAQPGPRSGRWDGTIALDGLKVPFSMQLDFAGNKVSGAFLNGEDRVSSTKGTLSGGVLRLAFPEAVLEVKIDSNAFSGKYGKHAVEGGPYCTCASEGEAGPDILGDWTVTGESWRIVVTRKGDDTTAHLLRPEDTNGAITGRFDGLTFMLHHFDGRRASLLDLEPHADGTLDVTLREPGAAVKKSRALRAGAVKSQ